MKVRKLSPLLGLFLSLPAIANQATGDVMVTSIGNWVGTANAPNESLTVVTDQSLLTNPAQCTKVDAYHVEPASNISRSMLLTAYTAQKQVNLVIHGGGCSLDNRPVIVAITLK